ncbi:MAG TPA: efflux transporter outer membrane subunit [Burkholderiaceae bacterium]|nr:efflux transporter outer membrane subunit [Burkholderiaceae bacterium]
MPHEPKKQRAVAGARATAICAVLLLAACSTAPKYTPPTIDVPAAFKESAGWKLADPNAAAVPDDWWLLFNDPVLNALQAQVVLGNQNLQASIAQYRVAQASLASSRAGLLPSIGVGASASRSSSGSVSASGTAPGTSYALSGSANWEIDLWGRLAGTVDSAQARLQASQDDLAAARLSTQATLAQVYFSLRATEAQGALLESTLAAYLRSLELTQNRYTAGVASSADVAQAQTQLKTAQAQLIDSNNSRAQLEHAIAALLGKAPAAFSLARTSALPAVPEVPLQLPSSLLERRPDIAAAERRVAAANAEIGVARAAFFPALTLSAGVGFRNSTLANLISSPNLFWSLGPALALAVFDGGARQAAVDSARAGTDQAIANYRQTVLTALQEVEDNLIEASSLQEQVVVQAEALTAAQKVLEVVSNQYRAGTVSYLNVVTAQATALSAERNLLDLRSRRLAAVNQLLKNIAGRWDTAPPPG